MVKIAFILSPGLRAKSRSECLWPGCKSAFGICGGKTAVFSDKGRVHLLRQRLHFIAAIADRHPRNLQILSHHWTTSLFSRTMLLAMNKISQNTTSSLIAGCPTEQAAIDPGTVLPLAEDSGVSAAELRAIKDEKLAAIRQAIDKGDYDSDTILEKALGRMLKGLEESGNE